MKERRVVVSGLGILSSDGIGRSEFCRAVLDGVSGIKPVSLFDTSAFKAKSAGEISNFLPQDILGPKGLRLLDRSTKLVNCAAKLALDDAHLAVSAQNCSSIGVVIADTLGSLSSICDFDKTAITEGVRYVNPAVFPNTVISTPSSSISIRFHIKGFNVTIATGFCAGIDAVCYAADLIRLGKIDTVLCGGVEELCQQTFIGFYKGGFLAGSKDGSLELSCPFDKRRNGALLGEGSAVFILEELQSALARKADILAEVKGYGMSFEPYRLSSYRPDGAGLKRAMRLALEDAKVPLEEISYISAAANSGKEADAIECKAIKEVFGALAKKVPVTALKSIIGECFSASGAMQFSSALCTIEKQMVHPTINYKDKDPLCDLNFVLNSPLSRKVDNVLLNAMDPAGGNSCLVISRFLR